MSCRQTQANKAPSFRGWHTVHDHDNVKAIQMVRIQYIISLNYSLNKLASDLHSALNARKHLLNMHIIELQPQRSVMDSENRNQNKADVIYPNRWISSFNFYLYTINQTTCKMLM